LSSSSPPSGGVPLVRLIQPYLRALAVSTTKATHERIYDAALKPLVNVLLRPADGEYDDVSKGGRRKKRRKVAGDGRNGFRREEEEDEGTSLTEAERQAVDALLNSVVIEGIEGKPTREQIKKAVFKAFFDMGATGEQTTEANRRRLYAVWRLGEDGEE
jgi:hypothetical protein